MAQPNLFADPDPPLTPSRWHTCERCASWPGEVSPAEGRPDNPEAYVRNLVLQIRRDVETIDQRMDDELDCFYHWRVRLLRAEVQRVRSLAVVASDPVGEDVAAAVDVLAADEKDRSEGP